MIITFALIYLFGCQPATSQEPTPTSSFNRFTKDIEGIRPLLFKPEDLGMTEDYYYENTQELLDRDIPADDVMQASIELGPRGRHGTGPYGALQQIWVYRNEEQASQVIEYERDRFGLHLGELTGFEPRLTNVLSGCKAQEDYEYCNFMGQHGRYVIFANMIVGGKGGIDTVLTIEDWGNFINAIQDRVIQQVDLEKQQP